MYIVFDTSANGPAPKRSASYDDTFQWPRLLHLSWIVLDENFKPIEDFNCYIKPEGFDITSVVEKKNSLEREKHLEGDKLKEVLQTFTESLEQAKYVFAHNLHFNEGVLGAEFTRKGVKNNLTAADKFCLMQEGTYYCKLPSKRGGGYKWPSLNELHACLFNQKYSPANNARADVIAASRCFIKMMKIGALEDIFE
jgi:DNA polymerase III epsilon subunit-like protein